MKYFDSFCALWLDIFFPRFCVRCGQMGEFLCNRCERQIKKYHAPIVLDLEKLSVDEAKALFYYESPVSLLIQALKFQSVKDIANYLIKFADQIPSCDVIAFTPSSKEREDKRGFNQAQLLAQELALKYGKRCLNLLAKKQLKKSQVDCKSRAERLRNLSGSIFLDKKVDLNLIKNKTILLVDDVITTGTTMNECALVLKLAGAKRVVALAVAHGS